MPRFRSLDRKRTLRFAPRWSADIRDWSNGAYTNTINGTSAANVFTVGLGGINNQVRLDMQTITLPAAFQSQVLTDVLFVDSRAGGVVDDGTMYTPLPNGFQRVFLTDLTVLPNPLH